MIIKITKRNKRNTIICTRADDTYTKSDLGPQLPFHDLAHYIAEKKFNLKDGFYGNIAKGYSIEQLSDKHIIKTLGEESWLAEILARALGSLYVGACTKEQFIPMISEELSDRYSLQLPAIDENTVDELLQEYRTLINKWNELSEGGSMELEYF